MNKAKGEKKWETLEKEAEPTGAVAVGSLWAPDTCYWSSIDITFKYLCSLNIPWKIWSSTTTLQIDPLFIFVHRYNPHDDPPIKSSWNFNQWTHNDNDWLSTVLPLGNQNSASGIKWIWRKISPTLKKKNKMDVEQKVLQSLRNKLKIIKSNHKKSTWNSTKFRKKISKINENSVEKSLKVDNW